MASGASPVTTSPLPAQVALSIGQGAFFIAYALAAAFWIASEALNWNNKQGSDSPSQQHELQQVVTQASNTKGEEHAKSEEKAHLLSQPPGNHGHGTAAVTTGSHNGVDIKADSSSPEGHKVARAKVRHTLLGDMLASPFTRCVMLDTQAIKQQRATLRAMFELGSLMLWYFLSDRTELFGTGNKSYSRDLFLCMFLILTVVAGMTSLQTVKAPVLLVRQQTEEWKGWMQVLFLLYHYYEAKEAYNAIRIFIAGYVWMTGFGNFIYYYKTGDFSLGRFAQMMWRLNFLVFFACVVLNNSYMLYYICPMHTLFTVMVYGCLGIAYHLNQSRAWLLFKIACTWLITVFLWHKPVFYAMWSPLTWLVGYIDPRKGADQDIMHEWYFRSSLDRYVWIWGMLCGMAQPFCQSALNALDQLPRMSQAIIRTCIVLLCGAVGYIWLTHVYLLPRNEYNKLHPFTSWIPITLWCVIRNLTPTLRLHHLRLYGWLGCITLETYICQFHIWMKTQIPDGQPKALLVLLPGYPLLNFAVCTAAYVYVSYRLFELTNALKNALVPHDNNYQLLRNAIMMAVAGGVIYATSFAAIPVLRSISS